MPETVTQSSPSTVIDGATESYTPFFARRLDIAALNELMDCSTERVPARQSSASGSIVPARMVTNGRTPYPHGGWYCCGWYC
jgi:hypothetical protein